MDFDQQSVEVKALAEAHRPVVEASQKSLNTLNWTVLEKDERKNHR